jgi:hypothetical protein
MCDSPETPRPLKTLKMGSLPIKESAISTQGLSLITLEEINMFAALQTRVDRKYVINAETCNALIQQVQGKGSVLDIDGMRSTMYQSVYFDTPTLDLYKDAAYRRRPRFKARTRFYQETNTAMLEVKTKDGRGRTVKKRTPHDVTTLNELTTEGKSFIDDVIGETGASRDLRATLTSQYQRTTIVERETRTRITCDEYLTCTDWENQSVSLAACIVESKSSGQPSLFDKWLWENGKRPIRISKYCTALAVLHPELPSNKWHKTIKNYF